MREVKLPRAVGAAPGPKGMILRIEPSIAAPTYTTQAPEWTSRIAAAWQKGVEAILETGRLLIEAKAASTTADSNLWFSSSCRSIPGRRKGSWP